MTIFPRLTGVALLALLAACSQEETLDGVRYDLREVALPEVESEAEPEAQAAPVSLPATQANTEWTQVGGNAQHYTANPALGSALTQVWSANIGAGNDRRHTITAAPIIAGGRVYTLDARSQVMAHTTSGAPVWSADLTPATENNRDASGGGLAYGDGRVFATTGFGSLVAIEAASGNVLWTQKTESVVASAPTYADGLVYFTSRDNRAWAVDAETGRIRWQLVGAPSASGFQGGAAPAISSRGVIFPFASSELISTLPQSGVRIWGAAISGERRGRVYAAISDITGDPVVVGDRVYVGTQSGRTVAMTVAGGTRLWTANEGAYSPVAPAGNSVFLVSDQAELIRLDAETGEKIWGVELPYFRNERERRLKSVHVHFGPILAGGRLIVASDDGQLRQFSPDTGALLSEIALPAGAASEPVVAGGTLYVVNTRGQLLAFR